MGDKEGKGTDPTKELATFRAEMNGIFKQIGAHIKTQAETMSAMHQEITNLKGAGNVPDPTPNPGPDPEQIAPNVTIEEMSREQFGEHLLEKMGASLQPLKDAIVASNVVSTRSNLTSQVQNAHESHEDFSNWHEEIKSIAKAHPTLDVEECYQMARGNSPDKAGEIDSALKKTADKKDAEEVKSNVTPITFGGLLPTSGLTSPNEDGAMTAKDAGLAAWDAVDMGEHLKAVTSE